MSAAEQPTHYDLPVLKKQVGKTPYEHRLQGLESHKGEYRGFCPWHESDRHGNPSLAIYKADDGTYCFKCMSQCSDKSGDVIKFVQLYDGISFREAVERIEQNIVHPDLSEKHSTSARKPSESEMQLLRDYFTKHGIPDEFRKTRDKAEVESLVHPRLGLAFGFRYDCDPQVAKGLL